MTTLGDQGPLPPNLTFHEPCYAIGSKETGCLPALTTGHFRSPQFPEPP